ncbi:MAG: CoA pyrophosphatase [Nitrospinota bacterium]|nr:CoA pyrophosphatase [Nitrospinota bacterium]
MSTNRSGEFSHIIEMDLYLITTKLKKEHPIIQKPIKAHPKKAAVLVMLYPKHNKTHILMIKRGVHLKSHGGEIGFPGGGYEEEQDKNLLTTALRETREEIGVHVETSKVIAQLPIVNTRLGFEITPFVSVLSESQEFKRQEDEVDEILEIPLPLLLATKQKNVGSHQEKNMVLYWFKHHRIWGASAKILHKIQSLSMH